ncbi:MAG: DUF3421 domain-containing protein [Alphaproteobacteria bacterium]|nr:DUF3421 domain-containing protein [Alphaproteobacteria bacterium]
MRLPKRLPFAAAALTVFAAAAWALPPLDTGLGLRWVDITQEAVKDPFQVGRTKDGEGIYGCRIVHLRDVEAGKRIGPFGRYCYVGSGGMERPYSAFQALAGRFDGHWVAATPGVIPENAFRVDGGHGPVVYMCRGAYEGGVHGGMSRGQNCMIGWEGDELQTDEFEVLVPRAKPR